MATIQEINELRTRVQQLVAVGSLAVLLVALLLAVPTAASRRVARRTPRTVGPVRGGTR